jgi:DNA-binding protein YbaB
LDSDITRIEFKSAELARRFDRLNTALDMRLLTTESPCKNVVVIVDGHGGLRQIDIAPGALRAITVPDLEHALATTVKTARMRARNLKKAARQKVLADIDGDESTATTLP